MNASEIPPAPPGRWLDYDELEFDDADPRERDTLPAPAPEPSEPTAAAFPPPPRLDRALRASDPALKLGLSAFNPLELRKLANDLGELIDALETTGEGDAPSALLTLLRQDEARVLGRIAELR